MKNLTATILLGIALSSCSIFSSLNSYTSIEPNQSFLLGNNKHGKFKVILKNVSNHNLEIYFAPIEGGTYSRQIVKVNQEITTKVPRNTAIVRENKSNDHAGIDLKATGDLNLGMTYNK